jgi:histidinol phosphatase-like PHP family hydrolase
LTHIPKDKIEKLAAKARKLGAEVVVLHGESPVEPVERGTNKVGVACKHVDILAHPGNTLTVEDAETARENNIYLELTSRRGHNLGNRSVARVALKAKAPLLVDTDAHAPEDLINQQQALKIALAAGLNKKEAVKTVRDNPSEFLNRL